MEKMTVSEAFRKIAYFCAYRERSVKETKEKLFGFDLDPEVVEELILKLQEEKYLDERRFAESYAGGKFRIKKWGKIKIKMGLKAHGVPALMIQTALEMLPEEEYEETLKRLFEGKMKELKKMDSAADKQKMYNYLCSKGFESENVLCVIYAAS